MRKVSFLIAAHNEEKIISKTLENLLKLPYKNYEVLIGLDGCTDNTEEIVKGYCKKSKVFRYFSLNLREGKPAVINNIIQKATGDIIIINDADWIFKVKSEKSFIDFLSVFDDPLVGGIAESYPVEWHNKGMKKGNLAFKAVAYGNYFWIDYQKKRFVSWRGSKGSARVPLMFLTNIFRKNLYKENSSLGDDFERTAHIMVQGKRVILFRNERVPRMNSSYTTVRIADLFKQKIRTAMARKQLEASEETKTGYLDYHIPAATYIVLSSLKRGVMPFFYSSTWLAITFLGDIYAKFTKSQSTKGGWRLRAKR